MQLGLSTYSFPWAVGVPGTLPPSPMRAAELLQYAAQRGIRYVQFGDNLPLHELSEEEREDLRSVATALRISIEVGTRRLTHEHMLLYLSIAKHFGSAFLRVVIDDSDYHPGEKEVIKEIKTLLPHFEAANVLLAIENHDRFPSKSMERIIRSTDQNLVGICLDTANSLGAGEGINEVLDVLAPYTVNLHIKDFTIKRLAHKMGFVVEGCAAGQGMLDIPAMIHVLRQNGRCRTTTLEVWSQPESAIDQTIAREKQWVEESINYLKTILP